MLSVEFFAGKPGGYRVLIGDRTDGLIPPLLSHIHGCKAFIVTDSTVETLHFNKLREYLSGGGIETHSFILPAGEQNKSIDQLKMILEELLKHSFDRDDILINLGGGVVSDIGGFAASVYMRGIRYVNIPTSLLSMVDSSVGGKTGIDLCGVKNAVGAFFSPTLVIESLEYLATLSESDIRCGVGEIIKYEMISGLDLLGGYIGSGMIGKEVIAKCCSIKKEYVEADLLDRGKRKILNVGHTFGHAFEAASGFALSHGEAVALGIIAETRFGESIGAVPAGLSDAVIKRVSDCGLGTDYSSCKEAASVFIEHDKKRNGDLIAIPFCSSFGSPFIEQVRLLDAVSFLKNG